jgi:hypothetical protein
MKRERNMIWMNWKLCAVLSFAILVNGLAGCASTATTAMWDPGKPDAMTNEHYDLAVTAITKRAKTDAQAALHMLRDDASRMRTNASTMMAALAVLYGVNNAVDAGDWDKARTGILELKSKYGQQ